MQYCHNHDSSSQQLFTSAKEVTLRWLVGWSADVHKNYGMDIRKSWMEDRSQPRIDPITFDAYPDNWACSGNNGWILMKKSGVFRWQICMGESNLMRTKGTTV